MQQAIWDTKSSQLIWWDEYMSQFDLKIVHVEGVQNKVADCLLQYYENDTPDEIHPPQVYVNTDLRLDPNMDELPKLRKKEIDNKVMLCALHEVEEDQVQEAAAMEDTSEAQLVKSRSPEVTVKDALTSSPPLHEVMASTPRFLKAIKDGYKTDRTFSKVLKNVAAHANFTLHNGLLYVTTRLGFEFLLVFTTGKPPGTASQPAPVPVAGMTRGPSGCGGYGCRHRVPGYHGSYTRGGLPPG